MARRVASLLLIIVYASMLAACADSNKSGGLGSPSIQELEEDTKDTDSYELSDYIKEEESDFSDELSNKEVTVTYEGEKFVKSVFCVGEKYLYICGINAQGKYFLGSMEKEATLFDVFPIEIDEDVRAYKMTTDEQDRCHVLWLGSQKVLINNETMDLINFEKSYITIMNKDGEIQNTIDVSDVFVKEQAAPFCFIVDKSGNYYFENNTKIIKLSPDGSVEESIWVDNAVEGIGCSKSGDVYCTYSNTEGNALLGRIEGNELVSCDVTLPSVQAIYGNIESGVNSDILMYNKAGGIYAYNADKNVFELRVDACDLPVSGEEVNGYGFLGDGRLCLLGQNDKETKFYYILAGE